MEKDTTRSSDSTHSKSQDKGVALWNRAKQIIPGGNQLLSKRSEMFLPGGWPSYFKRAKGIDVWDMNDRHLIDMSIMGIGTSVLGYANEKVNEAVKRALDGGTNCTLNCYEEVELAEKLISLHPWAEQVRFARCGGEACSVAIRIARAAAQKDKVAFCGYHGWADWYLASNLGDSNNLDGQLLPGLHPSGVPRGLKNTAFPFTYGKIEGLKEIIAANSGEIGVIITEVTRSPQVDVAFLKEVLEIGRKAGAVVIFDETSSCFRTRPGAQHITHGLAPDVVVLGKAMGNGVPISAIVGRKSVMEAAQGTFISSTFWSERLGFAAALEVIRQFETEKAGEILVQNGQHLKSRQKQMFDDLNLKVDLVGMDAAPTLAFKEEKPLLIKTVLTQELLKRGYLASNLSYMSTAHNRENLDRFVATSYEVFKTIKKRMDEGSLDKMLEGPICHSGFARLT